MQPMETNESPGSGRDAGNQRGVRASSHPAILETRAWVRRAVIGLNLCPFAKGPEARDRVRYVVSDATSPSALLHALADELTQLMAVDETEIETTLLIHPWVLSDFIAFNDFLEDVDVLVAGMKLEGIVQVASFHPAYRFAGTASDDPGNATNRSPHPILHLLRESSVARAVEAFPDAAAIFATNIETMEGLGAEGWAALQAACRADAEDGTDPGTHAGRRESVV